MSLANGCLLYYPLDEPHGTPRASSVASIGYPLVEHGTVGRRAGLRSGQAAVLDGTSGQYLSLMACPLIARVDAAWEWGGWVYLDAIDGSFLLSRQDVTRDWVVFQSGSSLRFLVADGEGGPDVGDVSSGAITASAWHYVRFYHDHGRGVVGIALDAGTPVESATSGPVLADAGAKLRFGTVNPFGAAGTMQGALQGWGFWDRVLSSAEATAFYNGGVGLDYPFGGIPDSPPPAGRFFGHNAASGLSAWYVALAGAATTGVDAVFVGDSITQGYLSSDNETNGYTDLLRASLQLTYGGGGRGFMPLSATIQYDSQPYNYPTQRYTYDIGAIAPPGGVDGNWGVHGFARGLNPGWSVTLSAQYGDAVDVWMLEGPSSDVFDVTIDGGSPARRGVAAQGSWGINRYSVATTLGTHSVKITGRGASDPSYVVGAGARVGATGVRVQTCAFSGSTAAEMVGSASLMSFIGAFANPKLVALAMTVNDFDAQTTVVTYKATMEAAVVYAQSLGASVLLVAGNPRTESSPANPQIAYDQALYQLADQHNCALVDLDRRWAYSQADSEEDALSSPSQNVHPTDAGHAEYAAEILAIAGTIPASSGSSAGRRSRGYSFGRGGLDYN